MTGLAFVGKIVDITEIKNADRVESATVVCGKGGKWQGVVQKSTFRVGDLCRVFLPDCIVPKTDEFSFMEQHKYRVKMRKFRGVPSEVLIMPLTENRAIGEDITDEVGCLKYAKPVPHAAAEIAGAFPSFIPKTDEPNFQGVPELVDALRGKPCVITEKADGTSTTAYYYDGHFGICSRNWELKETENNALWNVARKYDIERILSENEGIALQWETVGPKIQGNPMKLPERDMRLFDIYDIKARRYLSYNSLLSFASQYNLTTVKEVTVIRPFDMTDDELRKLAEGEYAPGIQREGIVIRSLDNPRISFKVINLKYKG